MLLFRPYLLKASYEWLLDNQLTPYLIIDVNVDSVIIPKTYIKFDQIILNISPNAVQNFAFKKKKLTFYTCFSKKSYYIKLPFCSIIAIYGYENNTGIVFYEDKMKLKNNFIVYNFLSEDCIFLKNSVLSDNNKTDKLNNFCQKSFFSKKKKSILRLIK